MKRLGLLLGFLAILVFLLPGLTAQDVKKEKDDEKAEKKDKDKGDKKDDDKKPVEKKVEEKKKLVYGSKFVTKIISIKPESLREFTIETKEIDPDKVMELNRWKADRSVQFAQRMQQLAQQQFNANRERNLVTRAQQLQNYQRDVGNYQRDLANFQIDLAKRQQNIYKTKPVDVRGTEEATVRSISPPLEFDDKGFPKKFTKKELDARRDKTGLPGFPVEFDSLKPGQLVEIYMVKQAAAAKGKKKGPDDVDPPVLTQPEFVLVVILSDGGGKGN